MADSFDHCEALVRAGDKDRFLATLFAPQKYRRALYALYAFNLEVTRTRELAREPMPGKSGCNGGAMRLAAPAGARSTPIRSQHRCATWWCAIACRRGCWWR